MTKSNAYQIEKDKDDPEDMSLYCFETGIYPFGSYNAKNGSPNDQSGVMITLKYPYGFDGLSRCFKLVLVNDGAIFSKAQIIGLIEHPIKKVREIQCIDLQKNWYTCNLSVAELHEDYKAKQEQIKDMQRKGMH